MRGRKASGSFYVEGGRKGIWCCRQMRERPTYCLLLLRQCDVCTRAARRVSLFARCLRESPLCSRSNICPHLSLSLSLSSCFSRVPPMDDPLRTFVWRYSAFMSFFLCRTIWSIFSTQWCFLSAASTVCTACRPLPACACLARFLLPTRCARPPLASLNFIHHLRPTKNAERN